MRKAIRFNYLIYFKNMKKMKNKILAYAIFPMLGLGIIGMNAASAHGLFGGFGGMPSLTSDQIATRQQDMFSKEAQLLGISIDDVKNGWAEGKSIVQIAEDHGITKEQLQQKMKDAQTAQLRSQLQTLVDKGIITQAQMDKRRQFVDQQTANGKLGRGFMGGFRSHRMMRGE